MSYPRELDEYEFDEIRKEYDRRVLAELGDKCSYCLKLKTSSPCKFYYRHRKETPNATH